MINRYYNWDTVFRFKTPNLGDRVCGPENYFSFPKHKKIDILDSEQHQFNKNCIIGGGGILHFTNRVENIAKQCKSKNKNVILWGIGHNRHDLKIPINFPSFLNELDMVGLRDWDTPYEWIPCPSCMSPSFDKEYPITKNTAFYSHYGIRTKHIDDRSLFNNSETFEEVIEHLGSAKYIVTNSYHGAYWGILLRRKVIVYPYSTKFLKFKHKPVLIMDNSHWSKYLNEAKIYENALTECREKNNMFYDKCKKFFT